ncbi:hypothetical protein KSP40_PGU020219 [Platanthera guangdongensis]|uniref:Protein root UVB sensitive 2, chloroplastic n=1 Tax=Platanthera guangdongensis TaxID=2320717 RepID=A0ABR2LY78_9ASPA
MLSPTLHHQPPYSPAAGLNSRSQLLLPTTTPLVERPPITFPFQISPDLEIFNPDLILYCRIYPYSPGSIPTWPYLSISGPILPPAAEDSHLRYLSSPVPPRIVVHASPAPDSSHVGLGHHLSAAYRFILHQKLPLVFLFRVSHGSCREFPFSSTLSYACTLVLLRDCYLPSFDPLLFMLLLKISPSIFLSVVEKYLRFGTFKIRVHLSSILLAVLSFACSLLFAAGLRPTPAQATAVSWILKDGMQHAGKLICSSMGARMDSEPKSWRILADVLYDLGSGLEILSPLCPQLFLELAGLGNFAKGMAVVAARATRLPIYSSFAKEGNLSDLFAKGEAISTLSNVIGIGAGIQLASTVCSTMQGKLIVAPLLSAIHIYSVAEEMRAAPVNTLNPQRTAMIVADFLKSGQVSSPGELRYRENLLFPDRIVEEAGSVVVGQPLRKVVKSASKLEALRALFPGEKFVIRRSRKRIDMILEKSANGEDALRGWLVAAYSRENELAAGVVEEEEVVGGAYRKMEKVFPAFISEVKSRGWHTDQFLDGNGSRFAVQHDGSKCFF